MKHHFRRTFDNSIHTFEEITTMLAEIESVLNSRPLCPISDDPNDLSILTPGHFLIGENLLSAPGPVYLIYMKVNLEFISKFPIASNISPRDGKPNICQRYSTDASG